MQFQNRKEELRHELALDRSPVSPSSCFRWLPALKPTLTLRPTLSPDAQTGGEPDMVKLFEDVVAVANELETNIAGLEGALNASIDSRERGAELLNRMYASAEAVHAKLAEDSEIWTALVKATEIWDERQKEAMEKSETKPLFKQIADEWGAKAGQANELRKQILEQRAESIALLEQIAADQEFVLALYELKQADRALEAMQKVSGGLGRMNDSMRGIVEQTKEVTGQTIPQ